MTSIMMDMDDCDIAHETNMLNEFGEEVWHEGQDPQGSPDSDLKDAPTSAPKEVIDSVGLISSSDFPQCP